MNRSLPSATLDAPTAAARPLDGLRLGVDGRPFSGPHTGYAMYLRALLPPLLDAGVRVTLVSDRTMHGAPELLARCEQAIIGEAGRGVGSSSNCAGTWKKRATISIWRRATAACRCRTAVRRRCCCPSST